MATADSFIEYISSTKTTFSYKLVLAMVLLENLNESGKVAKERVIKSFRNFYLDREKRGLAAEREREKNPSPLLIPAETTDEQVWDILVRYPLDIMKEYIAFNEEAVWIRQEVWKELYARDLVRLKSVIADRLQAYYEEIG